MNICRLWPATSFTLLTNCFNPLLLSKMANTKFEYVRQFEAANDAILLNNCFIVVRVDGKSFHRFSKIHNFNKPNDKRCLDLLVQSACHVMKCFYPDIIISYGQSDEFSFVIRRSSEIFNRRQNKIISLITSAFTSAFVFNWDKFFGLEEEIPIKLQYPPTFDGRCVLYPTKNVLLDYLKWRQVDCHINNLYNTVFHALTGQYTSYVIDKETNEILVRKTSFNQADSKSNQEATKRLEGTNSSDKNEILFQEYGINYNNELEQFKKGTFLALSPSNNELSKIKDKAKKKFLSLHEEKSLFDRIEICVQNANFFKEDFLEEYKWLLDS